MVVYVSCASLYDFLLLGHEFINEGKDLDVVNFLATMIVEQELEATVTHVHVRNHHPRVILHNPAEKENSTVLHSGETLYNGVIFCI